MSDNPDLANQPEVSGSRTQDFIDALKSGANLTMGPSDEPAPSITEDNLTEEVSQQESADTLESTEIDAEFSKEEDEETDEATEAELSTQSDSEDSELTSPASEDQLASSDIQELTVTGPNGRRKIKVDFSDKDKLKKHVQLAYGARKWQKERDDARSQLTDIQKEFKELKTDWDKVEAAFQEGGVKGLVNLLEGTDDAFDKFLEQEVARKQEWEDMSPTQRQQVERERELELQAKQNQKLQSDYESKLQEIQQKQEQAEIRELSSKFHPSFERYRFSGKLGDAVAEHEFDELLWSRALSNLEEIPENIELTQALIDKEFRKISQTIRKHLNTQVETKVKTAIDKTKKRAASQAQAKVKKGMTKSSAAKEFEQNMKSGDLVSGLTSFFKAGGKM